MSAPAITIVQGWPEQMRPETAAAYVDAESTKAFYRAVKAGLYPKPYKKPGEGDRWLKSELDLALKSLPGTSAGPAHDDEY